MKVGDYVRTNDRGIRRIGKIIDDIFYRDEEDNLHQKGNLIKSSANIIDLIEYEDIVKYKIDDEIFISEVWGEKNDYFVENFDVPIDLKDLNIISIVTKEQFSQMEYRIGE